MTLALETEIVGSAFDPISQMMSYTVQRGDRRWTVRMPLGETNGKNKLARRQHLATKLTAAMQGPHDGA